MLGTPPAFVLSQDQTLKKWYLKNLYRFIKSIFRTICTSKLLKNFRWLNFLFKPYFVQGVHYMLSCVIQFTRYSVLPALLRQLGYLITSSSICQPLFSRFFKFHRPSCSISCRSPERSDILSRSAQIVKHFFPILSKILFFRLTRASSLI